MVDKDSNAYTMLGERKNRTVVLVVDKDGQATYHARREDKDEGCLGGGVVHHLLHVQHWRLHEARAQVVHDERSSTERHSVRAKGTHQQHALQFIACIVPFP